MKSLIIILGLFDNGNVVVTSQAFPVACPTYAEMLQAANELQASGYANGVSVSCSTLDDKVHSFTVKPEPEGDPA